MNKAITVISMLRTGVLGRTFRPTFLIRRGPFVPHTTLSRRPRPRPRPPELVFKDLRAISTTQKAMNFPYTESNVT